MRRIGGAVIAVLVAALLIAAASHSIAAPHEVDAPPDLAAPAAPVAQPDQRAESDSTERPADRERSETPIAVEQLDGAPPAGPPARATQPPLEPEIADQTPDETGAGAAAAQAGGAGSSAGITATANPVLRPAERGWVGQRLWIPALGINVALLPSSPSSDLFPGYAGAYVHTTSSQPGRGTNSYIFAHAVRGLFLPLWGAQVGQEVLVQMSDGQVLRYVVTAVVRNVPCPDPSKPKPPNLPPVLANATHCDTSWMRPTASERLTLQTSQGVNRNYGAMVVIAEPAW